MADTVATGREDMGIVVKLTENEVASKCIKIRT